MSIFKKLLGAAQPLIPSEIDLQEQIALAEQELAATRMALETETLVSDDLAIRLHAAEAALCKLHDLLPQGVTIDDETNRIVGQAIRRTKQKFAELQVIAE